MAIKTYIRIAGYLLPVANDDFRLVKQGNDLERFTTREFSYSYRLKLPNVHDTAKLFMELGILTADHQVSKQYHDAEIVSGGVSLLGKGVFYIDSFDGQQFSGVFVAQEKKLIDALKEKTLAEVVGTSFDREYQADNLQDLATVDTGKATPALFLSNTKFSPFYLVHYAVPVAWHLRTLFDRFIAGAGYTYTGLTIDNDLWVVSGKAMSEGEGLKKNFIHRSRFDHIIKNCQTVGSGETATCQTDMQRITDQLMFVDYSHIVKKRGGKYFEFDEQTTLNVSFEYDFYVNEGASGTIATLRLKREDDKHNVTTQQEWQISALSGTLNLGQITFYKDFEYFWELEYTADTDNCDGHPGVGCYNEGVKIAVRGNVVMQTDELHIDNLTLEKYLPIKAADFLRFILVYYGKDFRVEGTEIQFFDVSEPIAGAPQEVDLLSKVRKINYHVKNYGQNNVLVMADKKDTREFAGEFTLTDQTLQPEKIIYEAQFGTYGTFGQYVENRMYKIDADKYKLSVSGKDCAPFIQRGQVQTETIAVGGERQGIWQIYDRQVLMLTQPIDMQDSIDDNYQDVINVLNTGERIEVELNGSLVDFYSIDRRRPIRISTLQGLYYPVKVEYDGKRILLTLLKIF